MTQPACGAVPSLTIRAQAGRNGPCVLFAGHAGWHRDSVDGPALEWANAADNRIYREPASTVEAENAARSPREATQLPAATALTADQEIRARALDYAIQLDPFDTLAHDAPALIEAMQGLAFRFATWIATGDAPSGPGDVFVVPHDEQPHPPYRMPRDEVDP